MPSRNLPDEERFLRSLLPPVGKCDICCEPFDQDRHAAVRLGCGHWFGVSCLRKTVQLAPSSNTCPTCRDLMFHLPPDPPNVETVTPDPPNVELHPYDQLQALNRRWDAILAMDEMQGVRFMQFLWKSLHPCATAQVLTVQCPLDSRIVIDDRNRALMRSLYSAIPTRDVSWLTVRTYLESDCLLRDPHASPMYRLVYEMLQNAGMFYTDTLSPESALLWWKTRRFWSRFGPEVDGMTALQFMLTPLSMYLAARPNDETMHWSCDHVWWSVVEERTRQPLNQYQLANPHKQDAVFTELRNLHHTAEQSNRPLFIGAQAEEEEVRRVMLVTPRMSRMMWQ